MRPIVPTPVKSTAPRSIVLPDGQQFFHDKLLNITQSTVTLTLNLSNTIALNYTADSTLAASLLASEIAEATASGVGNTITLSEPAATGGVAITSATPGSVGTLTANTIEPVVIVGTGFLTLIDPVYVVVVYPGGGGGPIYNFFTDIVVVDDTTITCNSSHLSAGTWPLLIAGPDWAAYIDVTVV